MYWSVISNDFALSTFSCTIFSNFFAPSESITCATTAPSRCTIPAKGTCFWLPLPRFVSKSTFAVLPFFLFRLKPCPITSFVLFTKYALPSGVKSAFTFGFRGFPPMYDSSISTTLSSISIFSSDIISRILCAILKAVS